MNSRLANTQDKTIEKVAHRVMWGVPGTRAACGMAAAVLG